MTSNKKADRKSSLHTKIRSYGFNYTVYASPWPLFDFINAIIVNQYIFQWFPVQSPHTSTAILFCDITKPEENYISNIADTNNRFCDRYYYTNLMNLELYKVVNHYKHQAMCVHCDNL